MTSLKIKYITVLSDENAEGYKRLKKSLDYFKWEFQPIKAEWRGFGTKIIESYKYIKEYCMDYDLVVFGDAYDTVVLAEPEKIINRWEGFNLITKETFGMILSAEKAAWPHSQVSYYYDKVEGTPFQYVNSGTWIANPRFFVNMLEKFGLPSYEEDDQAYFTKLYLRKGEKYGVILDNFAEIFLCTAHSNERSFTNLEKGLVRSNETKMVPSIIHFNGRTHSEPQVKHIVDFIDNLK